MAVILFDLDNTLLPCDSRYLECNKAFGDFVSSLIPGVSGEEASRISVEYDMEAVRSGAGFLRDRYPLSQVRALEFIAKKHGYCPAEEELSEAFNIGNKAHIEPYELYPGVKEMLLAYREAGHTLAICSKGDPCIQYPLKIDHNNLRDIFGENIFIWPIKKGREEIIQSVLAMRISPSKSCYMVGDSLHDDILGGKAAGLSTVYISGVAHSWSLNEAEVEPDFTIDSATRLFQVIPV